KREPYRAGSEADICRARTSPERHGDSVLDRPAWCPANGRRRRAVTPGTGRAQGLVLTRPPTVRDRRLSLVGGRDDGTFSGSESGGRPSILERQAPGSDPPRKPARRGLRPALQRQGPDRVEKPSRSAGRLARR